jgi:hypothetical protein
VAGASPVQASPRIYLAAGTTVLGIALTTLALRRHRVTRTESV